MKNLCKRIIAAALCLALTAAIVPTAVLAAASDGVTEQSGVEDGRFFPGRVIIGLNEPYFGDVAELFPELDIVKAVDQYLSVVLTSGKTVDEVNETIREMIGTTFELELAEKTADAVVNAIALLSKDPRVKYAEPDYIAGADELPDDNEAFEAGLRAAYAEYFSELHNGLALTADKVYITKCYGWFGGFCLADLYQVAYSVIDDFSAVTIGGYIVSHYQQDDSMILYKDGKVYSLRQAYDDGLISEEAFALAVDALNEGMGRVFPQADTVDGALFALRYAAKLSGKVTPAVLERFDFDRDGKLTVADALHILRIAAGLA